MISMEAIPQEIRDSARGVLWNRETRNGKATKVPYQPRYPERKAAVDDPTTWGSFLEALDATHEGKADGPGVVLGEGIVGVDLDKCRNPESGEVEPWAVAIVRELDSYTEVSPSGTGLHVLVRGALPPGRRRKGRVELYSERRFFTVTGAHLEGTPRTIEERSEALEALHRRTFGANGDGRRKARGGAIPDDDAALVERAKQARNGETFSRLWAGDATGYTSHSEADLALCNLLAFWTAADAGRMDCLFRASGLMRAKWDERRGDSTYGEQTIARALESCRETYTGRARAGEPPRNAAETEPPRPDPPKPYTYTLPVPANHFLAEWIAYASSRTDAAHELHEAAALVLLASATPTLRAQLAPYPGGLPTNLYALIVGDSTTSRKSTSKDLGRDVQYRALPRSISPDHFSPEGFVEHLAARPNDATTLYVDEFAELLDKLHHARHMAGLRGLLMTVYAGTDYTYRRHSKRAKGGEKLADEDMIVGPHLSILGATTPAIFEALVSKDLTSGLLGRFAIVMPTAKPPRRPFFIVGQFTEQARARLIAWTHTLHSWATEAPRPVAFAPGVLESLDGYAARLEQRAGDRSDAERAMTDRLTPMAVKMAILVAAGRPETPQREGLHVAGEDAEAALQIVARWEDAALRFAARVGESDFERRLQGALRLVRRRGSAPRSVVARQAHVDRRTLDSIRDTLLDRAEIRIVAHKSASGPSAELWEVVR